MSIVGCDNSDTDIQNHQRGSVGFLVCVKNLQLEKIIIALVTPDIVSCSESVKYRK